MTIKGMEIGQPGKIIFQPNPENSGKPLVCLPNRKKSPTTLSPKAGSIARVFSRTARPDDVVEARPEPVEGFLSRSAGSEVEGRCPH